jgi:selenocysteine lyase/cysteine desulfurase
MGSFHSEDVDVLMTQSDGVYVPPSLPFLTSSANITTNDNNNNNSSSSCDNGFLLDREQWTFLNHGAFGASLRVGYDRAEQWRLHLERQPLRYFDRDLLPHMVYSARRLASFCRAPRDALTLIPNVTYGLNTVLKGYANEYKENAHIILWDTSYGSLKKMAHEYCPNRVTEIPVSDYFDRWKDDFQNNPSDIFECAFLDTLRFMQNKSDNKNKLQNAMLILDHTTSNTALNMPLNRLSKLAKDKLGQHSLVMVDGAHGILAQELTLNEMDLPHVDFYVGNGHKWLSCPRGIGFLYCPRADLRDSILRLPAIISHGVGQGFQSRYLWDGCRDYAAALAIPAVLDFWEDGNDPAWVRREIQQTMQQAIWTLSQHWHGATTEREVQDSLLAPREVHSPMMVLIRLPDNLQSSTSTSDDAKAIQDFLYDNFIEVPIKCIRGVLYCRLSCHVYNKPFEYEHLANVILEFRKILSK